MINQSTNIFQKILILALIAFLCVVPFMIPDYYVTILIVILLYAYSGECWNVMSGFTGAFSFGHAAFFGIGAYTSAIMYIDFGITPYIGMLCGMVLAGAVGLFISYISFRYGLRGDYFALSTLAIAEILRVIVHNTEFFHSSAGILIPFKNDWTIFQFADRKFFYFIILAMVIAIACFINFIRKTKIGYYWVAIRENESAADSLGIDVFKYKSYAIILSAMFTALAGSFFAQYYSFIDSSVVFASVITINYCVAPSIIGGVGTVLGPIIGAVFFTIIRELSSAYLSAYSGVNMVVYGSILILFVMFFPRGIMGIYHDINAKINMGRKEELSDGTDLAS